VSKFTVLYDACVLYPAPLRDLLMHVAVTDLYLAKWTDAIHDEWTRNVLKGRPDVKLEQLQRTRDLMNAHVRDCLVTGYETLIDAVTLPDPNDRHVLAAAIRAGGDLIVTFNRKDFPERDLKPYGFEAQHPDDFLTFNSTWHRTSSVPLQRGTEQVSRTLPKTLMSISQILKLKAWLRRCRVFGDSLN
jgi:predicted nucleic acid-binding protein